MKKIWSVFLLGLVLVSISGSCTKDELKPESDRQERTDSTTVPEEGEGDDPIAVLSVAEFIESPVNGEEVWVAGYIVGDCKTNISYAEWEPDFSYDNAILLADTQGETDATKVISIQLYNRELKEIFSLHRNPDNYGRKASFYGIKQKYLGIWGLKRKIGSYGWVD